MRRHQASLERLPVPALAATCELYVELAAPLLSETELAATRAAVAEFVEPGGAGDTLQRRLLDFAEGKESWLEPFWDDWYLCDDTPLPVHVSPGFVLAGRERPQLERAAGLLAAAARFRQLVEEERLEPDVEDGRPRCMREYRRVLASTRVPGKTRDELVHHAHSRHVVVARGGRLWSLDVADDAGRPYARATLEAALRRIVDDEATPREPLGVLTTQRRRTWARVREKLDGAALHNVESALFVLVLEDSPLSSPALSAEAARLVLHGDLRNRWFDKSIQLVVAPNGVAGFCMEHSGFDGRTAIRFAELLVEGEEVAFGAAGSGPPAPRPLAFEQAESLRRDIADAGRDADALVARTDLVVLGFEAFGKRAIAGAGLSPDAFVQMAFQLAYTTLAGRAASTYESVDTKRFLHGRTEAMRCVSRESVALVRALRPRRSRGADAETLLRAAVARHTEVVRRCQDGRGVERHLLGLRHMLEPDEPLPGLFTDAGYTMLTRSVLSTSSTRTSTGVTLACFGPVVDDGLGVSYTIHADAIVCVVTSFHGHARDFAAELDRALRELMALLLG